MKNLARIALVAGLGGVLQLANAQATFGLVSAYYTLDSSGPFNFTYVPDSINMKVDFISGAPSFKVGDGTGFHSGVATIIYTVTSVVPIIGIDLLFQGDVQQWGRINWTETAEFGNLNLGSISGTHRGSSYGGGVDGAFTDTAHLSFSQAVTSFKVKKTFDMDIAAQGLPSTSVASVSLIEQNLTPVPEPMTMLGMAAGIGALVLRRRTKK